MNEHFFGVTSGRRVSQEDGKRLDAIAGRHGATFTWAKMPEGWRAWFACENLGQPHDQAVAEAVKADVRAAGIDYPV